MTQAYIVVRYFIDHWNIKIHSGQNHHSIFLPRKYWLNNRRLLCLDIQSCDILPGQIFIQLLILTLLMNLVFSISGKPWNNFVYALMCAEWRGGICWCFILLFLLPGCVSESFFPFHLIKCILKKHLLSTDHYRSETRAIFCCNWILK